MVLALLKDPELALLHKGEVQGVGGDPRLEPVLLVARHWSTWNPAAAQSQSQNQTKLPVPQSYVHLVISI